MKDRTKLAISLVLHVIGGAFLGGMMIYALAEWFLLPEVPEPEKVEEIEQWEGRCSGKPFPE